MATTGNFRYDYWDILKAPRLALSGKMLAAQARPLIYGYAGYFLLTYLALLIDGNSLSENWRNFGIFPLFRLGLEHWYSYAVWISGIVFIAGYYDYGNLTVAKLAFEELKGNLFYPLADAARDARKLLRSLWVAGIVIAALAAVLALIQGVLGLFGLIPAIGEALYALLYAVPFVLWSLFVVFLAFGLATSVVSLPAIVVGREQEPIGASFYVFNIIWQQPLRWITQTALAVGMAKVAVFVFGYFFLRSLQLTNFATSLIAGEKVQGIQSAGYALFEPLRPIVEFFTKLYPGSRIDYNWFYLNGYYEPNATLYVAGLLISVGMLLLWIVIISYGINVLTCSQLITFLYIRFVDDGERLLSSRGAEPDPRELKPKSANPPASS